MTRYQSAVATFSMWLTKARAPRDTQPFSLHLKPSRRDATSAGDGSTAHSDAAKTHAAGDKPAPPATGFKP